VFGCSSALHCERQVGLNTSASGSGLASTGTGRTTAGALGRNVRSWAGVPRAPQGLNNHPGLGLRGHRRPPYCDNDWKLCLLPPADHTPMSDEILTVHEFSALLRVANKAVYRMTKRDAILAFKIRGHRRFGREATDTWIAPPKRGSRAVARKTSRETPRRKGASR